MECLMGRMEEIMLDFLAGMFEGPKKEKTRLITRLITRQSRLARLQTTKTRGVEDTPAHARTQTEKQSLRHIVAVRVVLFGRTAV